MSRDSNLQKEITDAEDNRNLAKLDSNTLFLAERINQLAAALDTITRALSALMKSNPFEVTTEHRPAEEGNGRPEPPPEEKPECTLADLPDDLSELPLAHQVGILWRVIEVYQDHLERIDAKLDELREQLQPAA